MILQLLIYTGVSFGLIYSPSLALIQVYFKEKKSLANGLAMSGPVAAQFITAPLWVFFLETYSVRGAFLLMTGLYLQILVFGTLLRPMEFYSRKIRRIESHQNNIEGTCVSNTEGVPGTRFKKSSNENASTSKKQFTFEFSIFRKPMFAYCFIGFILSFTCCTGLVLGLPPYLGEKGYRLTSISYMLSVNAISDFIGRITIGFFLNITKVKNHVSIFTFYSICVIINGATVFLVPFMDSAPAIVILNIIQGFIGGETMALMPLFLAELIGPDKISFAIAYCSLAMSTVNAVTPVLLGKNIRQFVRLKNYWQY